MFFNRIIKRSIILIVTIVSIIVIVRQNDTTYAEDIKEDGLLLMKAFHKENIEVENMIFNFSSLVDSDKSAEDLQSFSEKVEKTFSVNLTLISHSNHKMIKYEGIKELNSYSDAQLNVVWVGVQGDNLSKTDNYKTYLVVSLSSKTSEQADYLTNYAYLKKSLQTLSIEPKIKINIQGSINQKLSHHDQQKIIMNMFNKLAASVSEGLNEKEVISLTGFSKLLNYSVNSNGNPINVQIASRYDPLYDKTTFTIGTPVITIEY
jgi:hypothetical protein